MNAPAILSLTLGVVLIGALCALSRNQVADLGPNSVIGLKTKATTASPEGWRIGHEAASSLLRAALITATVVVAVTAGTSVVSVVSGSGTAAGLAVTVPAVGLGVQAILMVLATVRADKAARTAR
ncbi:hypothetical protein GCM10007304_47070 [Rhodococcoides trifolii]|uniref:SdpI family protein n=1 Tax=Rhodococcoides trifolii TaxID=908250 RepID=A0A917G8M5_9NOCA|nr:SdpI family protein [Rhodococcus trifolii]GGG27829.1 hypothetical protein GCM10007304_47070 [Rhodococcus trifolii]